MTRRNPLAVVLAIAAAILLPAAAVAQVNPVFKQDPVTGNATQQQQIAAPSGYKYEFKSGSTLQCDAGSACPGGGVSGFANPTATAGPAAINGNATTAMRSDAAPAVQVGSASQEGIVQVDGSTITATAGKITTAATTINGTSCTPGGSCSVSASGRTILAANLTQFVSATGSDSTGNGTSGNPWASCQHAYAVDQTTYDLAGFNITCSMATGSYTAFCWNFDGPLVGQNTPAGFTIAGPGQFGSVLTGCASSGEFYAKHGARITLTTANIQPGAAGFGMLVFDGEIDFATIELLDQGSGSNFGDVAGGKSMLSCTGGFELVSGGGGNVTNIFVSEDHGLITLNCALGMSGTPTWSGVFAQGDLGGMVDGTGFTYSGGTPTGPRYSASSNGIVFSGGVANACTTANFWPGSVAGTTSTGGICQ